MAEDVCESWEDLIKDSPTNDEAIKHNKGHNFTKLDKKSNVSHSDKQKNKISSDQTSYSDALNKNMPTTQITKILTRDTGVSLNPKNVIQINFEDSSQQSMFLAAQQRNSKVKILQRPKDANNDNNNHALRHNMSNTKTIQEREAEYAKARMRIMGANYDEQQNAELSNSGQMIRTNHDHNSNNNLIRKPTGPSNSNFVQKR